MVAIIAAVPFSLFLGAIDVAFANPAVGVTKTGWRIDNAAFWQFVYWFDVTFVLLFLLDVMLRAFWMGMANYLMDCICWLDLAVSILDIVGLLVVSLPKEYAELAAITDFTPGLRFARFFRVVIRSIRFGRAVASAQNLKHKDRIHNTVKLMQKRDERYKDSVKTESINRTLLFILAVLEVCSRVPRLGVPS